MDGSMDMAMLVVFAAVGASLDCIDVVVFVAGKAPLVSMNVVVLVAVEAPLVSIHVVVFVSVKALFVAINIPQPTRPPALLWMTNGLSDTSVAELVIINTKDVLPAMSVCMYPIGAHGSDEPA